MIGYITSMSNEPHNFLAFESNNSPVIFYYCFKNNIFYCVCVGALLCALFSASVTICSSLSQSPSHFLSGVFPGVLSICLSIIAFLITDLLFLLL
jgi:hypothetical protein